MQDDRARQFMPFDGLRGFKEEIKKRERVVVLKKDLGEEREEILNHIIHNIKKGDMIEVIYYDKNRYVSKTGILSKIDFNYKYLVIVKTKIEFNDIYDLKKQ